MHPARNILTLVLTTASVLAIPAGAAADTELWSTDGPATPVAAASGHLAFSAFDPATKQYTLMIGDRSTTPVAIRPAGVAPSAAPFDVSIGSLNGKPAVLYSRCAESRRRCDIYRHPLNGGSEAKVGTISSRSADEAQPALTGNGRIVFVRRATSLVSSGFTARSPKVRVACDRVYIGDTRRSTPPRRLNLPLCGSVSALVTGQGKAVVIVDGDPETNPSSTVVVLRLNGGLAKIRARASAGATGFSPFRALAFSRYTVVASQVGSRPDLKSGFVRFPIPLGIPNSIPNAGIVGPFAVDGEETFTFVGQPTAAGGVCGVDGIPCRLVQSTGLPTG